MFHPLIKGAIANQAVISGTWSANNATLSAQEGSMVAYWKAEDLTDSIGSHSLTNLNSATFTSAKYNNGFTLDGVNQALRANDSSDWDLFASSGDATISFWTKLDTHSTDEYFIAHRQNSNASWYILHSHGNGLRFVLYAGSLLVDTGFGGEITDTNFHHILLSKIGNDYKLYKDNSVVASVTDSSTAELSGYLYIGQVDTGAGNVDGQIDEVGIWKGYGADSTYVSALYNSGTGAFYIG